MADGSEGREEMLALQELAMTLSGHILGPGLERARPTGTATPRGYLR